MENDDIENHDTFDSIFVAINLKQGQECHQVDEYSDSHFLFKILSTRCCLHQFKSENFIIFAGLSLYTICELLKKPPLI